MAFAAELKRSMIDRGLISGYDDIITPEILEQASKSFKENPAGIMSVVDDLFAISPKNYKPKLPGQKGPQSQKYLSETRLHGGRRCRGATATHPATQHTLYPFCAI